MQLSHLTVLEAVHAEAAWVRIGQKALRDLQRVGVRSEHDGAAVEFVLQAAARRGWVG